MHASSWVELLRRVPLEDHDKLVLVTRNGTEFNLQTLLRAEPDYLIIRGRLAASTEAGRIFFIPYEEISHLGFKAGMNEARVHALWDDSTAAPDATARDAAAAPAAEASNGAPSLVEQLLPAKAALLERLRRARPTPDAPRAPSP